MNESSDLQMYRHAEFVELCTIQSTLERIDFVSTDSANLDTTSKVCVIGFAIV